MYPEYSAMTGHKGTASDEKQAIEPPGVADEEELDAEEISLQAKSNMEALNAMTIAALSTFTSFSQQNLVVQVGRKATRAQQYIVIINVW
jgi:hypothetical protein